ncbi:MAG TPA: hypothetical protein VNO52_16575 [Methylomirabilota bacterium]|nr:hypothetical protein [Methylomirabilota bacterium]
MTDPRSLLICFAVREEARPLLRRLGPRKSVAVVVTGMGHANARRAVLRELERQPVARVLTCGFAGGLNPELERGAVVFDVDTAWPRPEAWLELGARPARFHCAGRVAITVAEKRWLREATGDDAVEMESGVIRALCRERGLLSATVRVISDTAHDDLPLDFNELLDARQRLSALKLAAAVAKSPRGLAGLLRLQRRTSDAATRLASVLARWLDTEVPGD